MANRILVVGGAGYIGSVCAAHLLAHGAEVEVYDNLSTGHRDAVTGTLHEGDIRDHSSLLRVLRGGRFDAVMHFAAKSLVGESVAHPLRYFDVNVGGTATLVRAMLDAGVQSLVFSSSCAVYGVPDALPIPEDHAHRPVSPYGESKAMVERMLAACRDKEGLRVTSLRYFNAAGASLDGRFGESRDTETHLIPLALQAAMGQRPPLKLFGTDYETHDGTCLRDYIHVLDLAEVHRLAVEALISGDEGAAFNVGTGLGTSVREVLESVARVTGMPVPHTAAPRREGDPPALFAEADAVKQRFGWSPKYTHIDEIVRTAAAWARNPRY